MSEHFHQLCRFYGFGSTSTTSFHSEKNAMIDRTHKLLEESLSKYVEDDDQHEW